MGSPGINAVDQSVDKHDLNHFEDAESRMMAASNVGTIVNKEGETGRAVLRPQPSNDPNDPLNWPSWQKYLTYLPICFFSFLATVHTSKFGVAIQPVAKEFHTLPTKTAFTVCFPVLALGLGNLFWVTIVRLVGRRVMYLSAIPLLCAMNIWSYYAGSFAVLVTASTIGAFAASAAESPTSAVVADLFFVHQRGAMLMIFHLALSLGFFFGPFLNAFVVQYAGWRWMCGWIAIASGVLWLVSIFAIHETMYLKRDVNLPESHYPPKRSFRAELSLTAGFNREYQFFAALWNTISIAAYPSVTWAGLTVGAFVGWNIVVQLTTTRLLTIAPYHFQLHSIGLFALSGVIGAAIAIFLGGQLIDIIATRMTERARGRREPEYRLPAIIFPAIIGPMGILTFGLCLAHKTHWIGPAFGFGMQGFGLTAVSNVLVTYSVDSYLPLAAEVLGVVFVIRGVSGCLLSLYAFDWIQATGTANAFGQMAAIQYFLLLFVLLFFFWGKKIRIMTASYGPLRRMLPG